MQILILVMFATFGVKSFGKINDYVQEHSRIENVVKAHGARLEAAKQQLFQLMSSCATEKLVNQDAVIGCGQKYLQMHLNFSQLSSSEAATKRSLEEMPLCFAPAKARLNELLNEMSLFRNKLVEAPKELTGVMFGLNTQYIQEQFDQRGLDAFAKATVAEICAKIPKNLIGLVHLTDLALSNESSFVVLYRHRARARGTRILAQEIQPLCNVKFDFKDIDNSLKKLDQKINIQSFNKYKKSICGHLRPNSGRTKFQCVHMTMNAFSMEWFRAFGGTK